jgi:hypothetical protein
MGDAVFESGQHSVFEIGILLLFLCLLFFIFELILLI